MTLENTNNKYPNSQEKSLNTVLNIDNTTKPNPEALELFFLDMGDDAPPLQVPFVPRKEQQTSKLTLNFRTSPKKYIRKPYSRRLHLFFHLSANGFRFRSTMLFMLYLPFFCWCFWCWLFSGS